MQHKQSLIECNYSFTWNDKALFAALQLDTKNVCLILLHTLAHKARRGHNTQKKLKTQAD